MAFDERLGERLRERLLMQAGLTEKKMFGGLAFMIYGNMACGVIGDDLVVRLGEEAYADALSRPYAREMDFSGHPMKGWVYVAQEALASDAALEEWVELGVAHALSLPKKAPKHSRMK